MEERQVSVEGETRPLPDPFLVLATQNPIELEGTFALPEAQLDRFLVRLSLGYPDRASERRIASASARRQTRSTRSRRSSTGQRYLAMRADVREHRRSRTRSSTTL